MASYRIGYDMTILWSINDRMGAAVPLEDKVVNLYYICDRGRFKADIQIQDGNVIVWDFPGIKQRYLGSYGLTVEILQSGGKRIIRKDIQEAFELVSASYMEKNDNGGANISDKAIITLSSELDIYRISPIVPEIGENNNWWVDGVDTDKPATIDKEELNKKQEVYVTEFDVASLLSAKYNNTFIQADTQSLKEAVEQGKTIVVPEDKRVSGVCACSCTIEDGIYLSIISISGSVDVWMDFVPEIAPDNISILHTSDIPTKSEIPTKLSQLEKDIDFGEAYYITSFSKNLLDEEIPDDGKVYFFPCQEQGLTEAIKNKKSIRLLSSGSFPEMGYLESVRAETDDMNYLIFLDGVHVIIVDFHLDGRQAEISRRLLITKDNINGNLESDIYYITSFDYQGILRGILNGDNRIQCYEPNLYQAVKDNKAIRLFFDMRYHDGYYEASSAVVDDFIYLTFENETSKFILDIVNDGSDLTFSIYDDAKIVNKLEDLENTKVDEARVAQLIALEHVYFRYIESENKVYAKGYYLEEWVPLDANVFFAIIGRPTTVHMGVMGDISGFNVSTNDFEIVTRLNGTSLTWIYNEKKYTLTFADGEQIITSEPYEAGSSYDDTEIREELSRLETDKADKTELTELSAEVGGLSEKIENLPSGESDVFKAIYGVTTYDEVKAAYEGGKVVHCDYNSYCYVLSRFTEGGAYFNAVNGSNSYRMDLTDDSWGSPRIYQIEEKSNKVTTISESSTDTQYPSAKAVYDAIQQSGTPSGDPMHYMFEAVGATYNATDEDIPMVGIYGDSYVHKAKHWHLNELGDITNEEMRQIYSERYPFKGNNYLNNLYKTSTQRTFICNAAVSDSGHTENYFIANSPNLKTVRYEGALSYVLVISLTNWAYDCKSLQKILTKISLQYATSSSAFLNAFGRCSSLEYVQLYKLSQSISFNDSPLLSKSSILYMIKNEAATSAIVITLHADVYARAMADAEIQSALEAHPNVSLASA